MKVQLFYFEGCPSYPRALDNLKEALPLEAPGSPDVEMVAIVSDEDARAKRFMGSPTIRIDGVDLEGPDPEAQRYAMACRVYADGDRTTGWPSVELIRRALK